MQINIQITDDRIQNIDEMLSYEGRITISDFAETIFIPIDLWNKEDYEKQWRDGLKRIQTHETSCLVTLIYDPYTRPLLEWWVLYRVGSFVCIQNIMFSDFRYLEIVGYKPFTPDTCYDFIPPRVAEFEDGGKPSEWCIPFEHCESN